ncbi:MAG: hypothetical protein MI807_23840 [Verrucomicrobiales bacterium]|nr:hypothetical protein [Verrucomicrobiales bacterium]
MDQGRPVAPIVLVILLCACGGLFYYLRVGKDDYPVMRTIRSSEGKKLNAELNGKFNDTIYFKSPPGGKQFEYPISKLSLKDRILTMRLREKVPVTPKEDNYISNRRKVIAELKTKASVWLREISSNTLPDLLQKRREEEYNELLEEIRKLEVAIETYKWRNRQ